MDQDPLRGAIEKFGQELRANGEVISSLMKESVGDLSKIQEPGIKALRAISGALAVSAESISAQAAILENTAKRNAEIKGNVPSLSDKNMAAIAMDARLSQDQKDDLVQRYRAFLAGAEPS